MRLSVSPSRSENGLKLRMPRDILKLTHQNDVDRRVRGRTICGSRGPDDTHSTRLQLDRPRYGACRRERACSSAVVFLPDPAQGAQGIDEAVRRAGLARYGHLVCRTDSDRGRGHLLLGQLVGSAVLHRLWRALWLV